MNRDEARGAVIASCEALRDLGIPAFTLYHDDEGWHLAGPKIDGTRIAAALRDVADRCEEQLRPDGVTLN